MLQPVRRRTWSIKGKTPRLIQSQKHTRLSCISAISVSPKRKRLNLHFSLRSHNFTARDILEFMDALRRRLKGQKLLIIWDRWSAHRAKLLRQFFAQHRRCIQVEYFPSYCPELNPVEYLWSYSKYSDLANWSADNAQHLNAHVRASLTRASSKQRLLRSFFHQAGLEL